MGWPADAGFIAVDQTEERPLGAAWDRLYPAKPSSYGFVLATIPAIVIGALHQV